MTVDNDAMKRADARFHLHPMTNPTEQVSRGPEMVSAAKGIRLTIDDRTVIDGLSGLGCVNIGYGNEEVSKAAYEAMRSLSYCHTFFGYSNGAAAELAQRLAKLTDHTFEKFFFASTGSDANESAVKIAYHYWRLRGEPQRRMLLSRRHSYHGNTVVATSLTGIDHYLPQFGLPLPNLVAHADSPYWYKYGKGKTPYEQGQEAAASLERIIEEVGANKIAAFFAEPMQATGGMIMPPEGYWNSVREICTRHDILLVADEVVTGFGKTGKMFGFQTLGFTPDMITLAKGLTSSYFPMSAVGISSKINAVLSSENHDFEHGFTNCGHPVGAAVALANLRVIEQNDLVAHVAQRLGPLVATRAARLQKHPAVGDTRSLGVLAGIEFSVADSEEENAAFCNLVIRAAYERGLFVRASAATLHLVLPMITTVEDAGQCFDIIDAAIEEAYAARSNRERSIA
ncbi:aspartate aminotransferase family protein [Paraburkholderia sediminicola]|jgi:putrescine aminotransferase|uniref:aminotransferase family protein n=1 Tax=Paraburkholderia sediminicola TaxID=458836 RepID=UPI0038BA7F77